MINVNEGTIIFDIKLAKDEYFELYILESSEGSARKYYKITPSGKNYLEKMVIEWNDFVNKVSLVLNDKVGNYFE